MVGSDNQQRGTRRSAIPARPVAWVAAALLALALLACGSGGDEPGAAPPPEPQVVASPAAPRAGSQVAPGASPVAGRASSGGAGATTTLPPPADPTPSPQPEGASHPSEPLPAGTPADRELAELSPEAQRFLEGREGRSGVAVLLPGRGVLYSSNGDQPMSMASVVKVAVMLAVMDRAVREGRELTGREMALLRPMIQESDNESTTVLWNDLGGSGAVEEYLRSIEIEDILPNAQEYWGASRATARSVARLFGKLAFEEILDRERRALAVELLSGVVPSQRWGVTAGVPDERPAGTIIGLKDGWYPAGFGWWVNSAGMLIPGDDRPAYTIAVLTRGQPSWEYGIETIEGVARSVHEALHGRPTGSGG